eukprot:3304175-Alexandrium_andersonii.AAC.1
MLERGGGCDGGRGVRRARGAGGRMSALKFLSTLMTPAKASANLSAIQSSPGERPWLPLHSERDSMSVRRHSKPE